MKHLIFLDIDGTLIQPDQKTNTNRLPFVIKRLSRKGVLFALNSNRSLEDVRSIYRKFSLNGPMILENGVYFLIKNKKRMLVKATKPVGKHIFTMVKDFANINKLNCKVLFTDTVRVIKSKGFKTTPLIVLINSYRKYTASIHIYRYGVHDKMLGKKLATYLHKRLLLEKMNVSVESPRAFGNVTVSPKDADKGKALQKIKQYYPGYTLHMVGDDMADLKTLRQIRDFFAVANAEREVKEKSRYVSPFAYTKGVVDILEFFEKKYTL